MSESLNLPQTFIDKYHKLLGSSFASFIAALNSETKRAFRLNPLKYNFQNVSYSLDNLVPGTKLGYYGDVSGKSSDWVSGYVYSQDPSAMFPAIALNVHPGEKVLDLCAAPGGKTTALASDLAGEGVLVANEISKSRAKILRENLERWGADNVAIINEDSKRVSDKLPHFFDAILVDAPCSGEGMFRKNPEAIQYWSPEYVLTCQSRQKEILTNAVKNLRSGGRLVYSTCTFSPEEDEQIVEWLVNKFKMKIEPITEFDVGQAGHPEWSKTNNPDLAKTRRFWPQDNVGEGQFVALLSLPEQIGGDVKIKKVKKDDMNPKIRTKTNFEVFIMAKLSKQDKIDIYNSWKNYGKSSIQLGIEFGVNSSNLRYLLALIDLHGIEILDTSYTNYSIEFKQKAIRRVLLNRETANQVSLELGLSNQGTLHNWIRKYKEDGYNVINHKKGRPTHGRQRQADSRAPKASKGPQTEELKAYCRDRIYKKIGCLSLKKNQKPEAQEITSAVTKLRQELKVTVDFVLDAINLTLSYLIYLGVIITTQLLNKIRIEEIIN